MNGNVASEKNPSNMILRNGKQRYVLVPISKNRERIARMDTDNSSMCLNKSYSLANVKRTDQLPIGINSNILIDNSAIRDRFEVLMDDTACEDQSMQTEVTEMEPFSELDDVVPSKKRKICEADGNYAMKMIIDSVESASRQKEEMKMEHSEQNSESGYLTAKTQFIATKLSIQNEDKWNPLYATSDYGMEIYKYQIYREQKHVGRPRLNYIDKQKELKCAMRTTLIDWFSDVCQEYKLCSATFFLATSLVDRTLSVVDCPRMKLQLLGATSVYVAAKMEEVYPPTLKDIVYVTENSYTETQVLRMEKVILRVVDFELNVPMVDTFASFFTFFRSVSVKANCLMWYLLELSSLHYECLRFKPSYLAAGAYVLAELVTFDAKQVVKEGICGGNDQLSQSYMSFASALSTPFIAAKPSTVKEISPSSVDKFWTSELADKTGIPSKQIVEPVKLLSQLHRSASQDDNKSIFLKYSSSSNYQVSCAVQMPEIYEL